MLEMLINPKKAERHPWELFFVGAFYAFLSIILVNWIFSSDPILSQDSGILIVTFTVMFSMPFMYYTIRFEEKKIVPHTGVIKLLKEHERALLAFLWLFLGFVVAFSIAYIVFPEGENFRAQIETFCMINKPTQFSNCATEHGISNPSSFTASATQLERFQIIFVNNIYVLIFTLLFSLIFGAGVIFILAWNASVIAAAVGIFAKSQLSALPLGLLRYMIHGIPEITSYFLVALAGGIVSVAVIKHEAGTEKFWEVLHDSFSLIVLSLIVLLIAALMEVFITPILF